MLKNTFTLGPASSEPQIIRELLKTADRFRLNASHLAPKGLHQWLEKLENLFEQAQRKIPVVIDLQGAKMRIGRYPNVPQLPVNVGEEIGFVQAAESNSDTHIPVPHASFFKSVQVGDIISLNDARVRVTLTHVQSTEARATLTQNGPLSSFKGLNRAIHPIPYSEVSKNDRSMIAAALEFNFTEFAFSFVHTGDEAALLRPLIQNRKLTAKLERPESLTHLKTIDAAFDETWLCRGDLGAQAGIENLGRLQAEYVQSFPFLKKPHYLAGQVLEHMTSFSDPTRSEVVHLYDIQKQGFSGIVLSDETAIGKNPTEVANVVRRLTSD